MTGDIGAKLLASDASQSLRMEASVAHAFRKVGWPSNQGMYYTDTKSGKIREVDVHAYKTFSKKGGQIGEPVANFHIFAECKNLLGQHILFSPGDVPEYMPVDRFWIGDPTRGEPLVEILAQRLNLDSPSLQVKLIHYLRDRTHPDDWSLMGHVEIPPPEVDVVARGFRETNLKIAKDEDASAIWRTCQSLMSAVDAARTRSFSVGTEPLSATTITGEIPGTKEWLSDIATFLDFALARTVFFHSAIFTHAGLWSVSDGAVSEIRSARLIISNIDFDVSYVDIVSAKHVTEYVASATSRFDRELDRHLKKTRKRMRSINWEPGQQYADLVKLRPKKKTTTEEKEGL